MVQTLISRAPWYVWLIAAIVLLRLLIRRCEPMDVRQTDQWGRLTATERGRLFELWCADLLRRNGFWAVRVCGQSGDQGVDITARRGLRKYAIQCKCYSHPLGNSPVQEINAGMEIVRASAGVVMTNSTFTKGAIAAAKLAGRDRPIFLWDRDTLQAMCGGRPLPKRKASKRRKIARRRKAARR